MDRLLSSRADSRSTSQNSKHGLPGLLGGDGRAFGQLRYRHSGDEKHVPGSGFKSATGQRRSFRTVERRKGEARKDRWIVELVLLQGDHVLWPSGWKLRGVHHVPGE